MTVLFIQNNLKAMIFALVILSVTVATNSMADEAQDVMDKVDLLQRTASDSTLTKSRLSSCKFGKKNKKIVCSESPRVKELISVSKQFGEHKKDSRGISIIIEPASDRGVGMLTYTYDDETRDTESWLYLSALGRVKRMASGTGEDQEPVSFFGSEFTTEDLENGKTDEFTYTILQEGAYGKREVWVIEARPKPVRLKKTDYSKIRFWIDKERYLALKVQSYDKREKPYKRIMFKRIEKINKIWVARDVTIMNLQTNRLSNMQTQEIAIGVAVNPEFLTQRALTDFAFREKELDTLRQHIQ